MVDEVRPVKEVEDLKEGSSWATLILVTREAVEEEEDVLEGKGW